MDPIRSSEMTDKRTYLNRRTFIAAAAAVAGGAIVGDAVLRGQQPAPHGRRLATVPSSLSTSEKPNTWGQITTYNNFYEYDSRAGAGPSELARNFKSEPWSVVVDGECARRGRLNLEDILKGETLEDRIYRHRCVEAWSMVIPWVGFPLAHLIERCEPTSKAAFVEFTTLLDPGQFPAYAQAYGFYANVNPTVDHPNWSQAAEARLPSLLRSTRTQLFNGYADQVAGMYAGMDLRRNY
jgi:methionine sulfoxide reductase catalytic subunit